MRYSRAVFRQDKAEQFKRSKRLRSRLFEILAKPAANADFRQPQLTDHETRNCQLLSNAALTASPQDAMEFRRSGYSSLSVSSRQTTASGTRKPKATVCRRQTWTLGARKTATQPDRIASSSVPSPGTGRQWNQTNRGPIPGPKTLAAANLNHAGRARSSMILAE